MGSTRRRITRPLSVGIGVFALLAITGYVHAQSGNPTNAIEGSNESSETSTEAAPNETAGVTLAQNTGDADRVAPGDGAGAQNPGNADRIDPAAAPRSQPAYRPMTEGQRANDFVKRTLSPFSFVAAAAGAGYGQWRDRPKEWKEGSRAYGLRYESSFAEHVTREVLLFGTSSMFHEDNRFFRSGEEQFGSRLKYAMASSFLARNDTGARRLSLSRIIAFTGAAFLSRLWQPPSTDKARNAGLNLASSVGFSMGINVVREFWPKKK